MPNSLRSKLSSLRYKRLLTDEEYNELIKKLGGHDREIRAKAIDEFADRMISMMSGHKGDILQIAEQLKEGAE